MKSDTDDEWEFDYDRDESSSSENENEKGVKSSPRVKRTRSKSKPEPKVIKATRQLDGFKIQIGDCVLIEGHSGDEPYIALVAEFKFAEDLDCMRVKLIWLTRRSEISTTIDTTKNEHCEVYATKEVDWADLNTILERAVLYSSRSQFEDDFSQSAKKKATQKPKTTQQHKKAKSKGDSTTEMFFVEKAVNLVFRKVSSAHDFSKIYHGPGTTNMEEYHRLVSQLVPTRQRTVQPTAATTANKLNNTGTAKKTKKKHVKTNDQDMNNDFQDQSSEGDEYGLSDDDYESEADDEGDKRKRKRTVIRGSEPHTPSLPTRLIQSYTGRDEVDFDDAESVENSPSKKRKSIKAQTTLKQTPQSPYKQAQTNLHVASIPESLPCRENEFSQIHMALEGAIESGLGSCIYISGIPGTGKTATVREVVKKLQRQADRMELPEFRFVEINGMKVLNPQDAYELLWQNFSGKRVSPTTAVKLLEKEFNTPSPRRTPVVVLMDELDQLVTRNQAVMYNFFNWPTLQHSRLIVVAVANTMDLPERTLSNKISSRLGLTRIQFATYTAKQLETIIKSRLENNPVVQENAVRYASSALARVGDARRALDICRRAVELAEVDKVKVAIAHIQAANKEMTNSPMAQYLRGMSVASKIFLCAVLARLRRGGIGSATMSDVVREVKHLVSFVSESDKEALTSKELSEILYDTWEGNDSNTIIRMNGFTHAVTELVEAGVLAQQASRGEITSSVQLAIGSEEIKTALKDDIDVRGML